MAQDFSDPLTSAAYASIKTELGNDHLLAPSPVSASIEWPNPVVKTKVNSTSSSTDPLSSPTVKKPSAQNRLAPSTPIRQKAPSSVPATKTTGTQSNPNRLSDVSSFSSPSFSSPSSSLPHPFSDPLANDNSNDDHEPYMKPSGYNYSQSKESSTISHSSAISSLPTSPQTGPIINTRPPVPPAKTTSSQKAVSPAPIRSQRESSYDQQRVKAPQYLHITIPDTDRRGKDGMFLLSVQTNMPRYKRQSYQNVTRSYLEFVRLREHLMEEHPEVIVPVLPPERSLVSALDIQSMRLFVERIGHHPVLSQDYELQMFIESEFGFLPPAKPKRILGKLLNISVKRFSTGANSTLSLGDTDDDFEEERTVATKVETKLQAVIKGLDKEIKARRDFSSKESELATLSNAWAAGESLQELARTFKLLAKPLDGMAKASKAQVGGDATVLGSFLEYKLQHVQTLSGALDYRLSVLGEYDAAIKSTESKRKTMERLRSSTNINPEKVTDSIDDLEDAVLFEGNMKKRMEQVTSALTKDLGGYKRQSEEDLLRALQQYSQRQIGFERAKLEELLSVGAGLKADQDQGEAESDHHQQKDAGSGNEYTHTARSLVTSPM